MRKRLRTSRIPENQVGGGGGRDLPEEIIMEILLYMDAEDVKNFKLVSKFWWAAISDPDFVNTHFNRPLKKKGDVIILSTITKPINLNSKYVYRHFSIPSQNRNQNFSCTRELQFPPNMALSVEASLDGLLLLQNKYNPRQLYISNPVTRAFAPLPPVDADCANWALVRDTKLHKYKVFGLRCQTEFCILALDNQLIWKDIGVQKTADSPVRPFRLLSHIFVAANNIVYWLSLDVTGIRTGDTKWPGAYVIYFACLDIGKFGTIKVQQNLVRPFCRHPREMADFLGHRGRHLLSEVKGSLCLTIVSTRHLEMFLLEDRDNSVWTKSHRIDIQSLSKRPYFLGSFLLDDACLVAVTAPHSTDPLDLVKILVHHKQKDRLLLFHLKTQKLINLGFLSKDQQLCRSFTLHCNSLLTCPSLLPALTVA